MEKIEIEESKSEDKKYDYVCDFEWTKDMELEAESIIASNTEKIQDKFLDLQERNWNKFYKNNSTNFFKDRHYLLKEFDELAKDPNVSPLN